MASGHVHERLRDYSKVPNIKCSYWFAGVCARVCVACCNPNISMRTQNDGTLYHFGIYF